MKTFVSTWLVLTGIFSTSLVMAADGAQLAQFFNRLEGHWEGNGSVLDLQNDGTQKTTHYRAQLRVEQNGDTQWNATTESTTDSGLTRSNSANFSVQGDFLFLSTNSQLEPVQIIESSPLSLTYRMRRAELYTGRVYDFTFQNTLDASGREFNAHNTTELNNVVISDEQLSMRRW